MGLGDDQIETGGGNTRSGMRSLIRRKQVDSVHVKSEGHHKLAKELSILQLLAIGISLKSH